MRLYAFMMNVKKGYGSHPKMWRDCKKELYDGDQVAPWFKRYINFAGRFKHQNCQVEIPKDLKEFITNSHDFGLYCFKKFFENKFLPDLKEEVTVDLETFPEPNTEITNPFYVNPNRFKLPVKFFREYNDYDVLDFLREEMEEWE